MCMCVVSLFTDYNFDLIDRGGLELLCDSEKIHKVNVDLPHGADEAKLQSFMCFSLNHFIIMIYLKTYCVLLIN